jgi:hypothetical protein
MKMHEPSANYCKKETQEKEHMQNWRMHIYTLQVYTQNKIAYEPANHKILFREYPVINWIRRTTATSTNHSNIKYLRSLWFLTVTILRKIRGK